MPAVRTEVTELATGLGMLDFDSEERAMVHRPVELVDVDAETWTRLADTWRLGTHRAEFGGAFANGRAFLASADGLRGRRPETIEWKGNHKAPGQQTAPVDLRIDHVFLVSCKYTSRILLNASPPALFDGETTGTDWFADVALDPYQAYYEAVRLVVDGGDRLPPFVGDLAAHHRQLLKAETRRRPLGPEADTAYLGLARAVGRQSAARWRSSLGTKRRREAMLWRLLRIVDAPYFVLGAAQNRTLRLRVTTPWDWRRRFEFRGFEAWGEEAGQPRVAWRADVRDHETGGDRSVEGHVEVRWSHGRFAQPPEAKVYLDTPHADVPGYVPLI